MVAWIPLTQNKWAKIDVDCLPAVISYNWWAHSCGYAYCKIKGRPVYMHRLLMRAKQTEIVDHKNQNKLDNTLQNLRICTRSQNGVNSKKKQSRSKWRGLEFDNRRQTWSARVRINYKKIGVFGLINEEDAATAYNFLVHQLQPGFAQYNCAAQPWLYGESANGG